MYKYYQINFLILNLFYFLKYICYTIQIIKIFNIVKNINIFITNFIRNKKQINNYILYISLD